MGHAPESRADRPRAPALSGRYSAGRWCAAAACLVAFLACDGTRPAGVVEPPDPSQTAREIRILPFSVLIVEQQRVPLRAVVLDQNGDTLSSAGVVWTSADPAIAMVDSTGMVTGVAAGETKITAKRQGLTAELVARVVARGSNVSLTPRPLNVVLGPLVLRAAATVPTEVSGPLGNFDQRYLNTEMARFQDWLKSENDPNGSWIFGQHYGGLRGRLGWAIRTGEPYGAGITDETQYAYARGRRIVKRYLQYTKAQKYLMPAHHNTGLADIEALYVLEGDVDARNHIHVSAVAATTDRYGYLKLQNPSSDARIVSISLQSTTTAHRLGIPYGPSPANMSVGFDAGPGSWKAVARRQIQWLTDYNAVKPDGSIPSPAHGGPEAFLFNAMLAKELLQYCASVEWDAAVFDLARLIMDHMVDKYNTDYAPRGWSTMPYLSSSTGPAPDLAAFYVWPALALWQETGEQKYYAFALQNLRATNNAYISAIKQWNQVYSTMAEGAEALFGGQRWR